MINIHLSDRDFRSIRFMHSPMMELVMGFRLLLRRTTRQPTLTSAAKNFSQNAYPCLSTVIRPEGYVPDFLIFGARHLTGKEDKPVCKDLEKMMCMPESNKDSIRSFLRNIRAFRKELSKEISQVSGLLFGQNWSQIANELDKDIYQKSKTLTTLGYEKLFSSLHSSINYSSDIICIDKKFSADIKPGGKGVALVPSFYNSDFPMVTESPDNVVIFYPIQNSLSVPTSKLSLRHQLQVLIGGSRASLLKSLEKPATTQTLARTHGFSPSLVSQHLHILSNAGMVDKFREGKKVFYFLTARGIAFLHLYGTDEMVWY